MRFRFRLLLFSSLNDIAGLTILYLAESRGVALRQNGLAPKGFSGGLGRHRGGRRKNRLVN
jgi:hypothetical protein